MASFWEEDKQDLLIGRFCPTTIGPQFVAKLDFAKEVKGPILIRQSPAWDGNITSQSILVSLQEDLNWTLQDFFQAFEKRQLLAHCVVCQEIEKGDFECNSFGQLRVIYLGFFEKWKVNKNRLKWGWAQKLMKFKSWLPISANPFSKELRNDIIAILDFGA